MEVRLSRVLRKGRSISDSAQSRKLSGPRSQRMRQAPLERRPGSTTATERESPRAVHCSTNDLERTQTVPDHPIRARPSAPVLSAHTISVPPPTQKARTSQPTLPGCRATNLRLRLEHIRANLRVVRRDRGRDGRKGRTQRRSESGQKILRVSRRHGVSAKARLVQSASCCAQTHRACSCFSSPKSTCTPAAGCAWQPLLRQPRPPNRRRDSATHHRPCANGLAHLISILYFERGDTDVSSTAISANLGAPPGYRQFFSDELRRSIAAIIDANVCHLFFIQSVGCWQYFLDWLMMLAGGGHLRD